MSSSIEEFSILKFLVVKCNPRKAPLIIQVNWISLPCGWIKVNTDGAVRGSPGHAAYGGLFRDKSGAVFGCFAFYNVSLSLFMLN